MDEWDGERALPSIKEVLQSVFSGSGEWEACKYWEVKRVFGLELRMWVILGRVGVGESGRGYVLRHCICGFGEISTKLVELQFPGTTKAMTRSLEVLLDR